MPGAVAHVRPRPSCQVDFTCVGGVGCEWRFKCQWQLWWLVKVGDLSGNRVGSGWPGGAGCS